MRFLHLGGFVQAATDDVAASWPAVEAEALALAAEDGGPAFVHTRTDRGGYGSMPIHPLRSIAFTNEGVVTQPDMGVIVSVSADAERFFAEARAASPPQPDKTDEEIADLVRSLKEERPDLDWENLLMGQLAGPATPDRPDLPVWDYLVHIERHPEVRLEALTAVRFPVRFFDGTPSVTSVDEELKPLPSSYKGTPPTPRWIETPQTVIGRWAALRDAGLVAWDPEQRGVVHVKPMRVCRAAIRAWSLRMTPADL